VTVIVIFALINRITFWQGFARLDSCQAFAPQRPNRPQEVLNRRLHVVASFACDNWRTGGH
jgi:hypothetical protein